MLQDSLRLMEKRVERINKRQEEIRNLRKQTNLLNIGMESVVLANIRKDYPDLAESYKKKEITYRELLQIYDQLVWGNFDSYEKFLQNGKEGENNGNFTETESSIRRMG